MNFDGKDLTPERSEMPTTHPLLIIGAGPFGLAVAADARYHGLPVSVIGKPMAFWRENMPRGMVLRSASDWHLDPQDAFRPDTAGIPFLAAGNMSDRLKVHNGCPILDEEFQTNVPGFYATGALATQDFGPFFGFTLAARGAAVVIGRSVRKRINTGTVPT